ncbi:MAG: ATP-binding protein [Saprospiraceae bacterium]|nr:ATP-binding protein [Saprospiraceae bacterium]
MVDRFLLSEIRAELDDGKAIIILGTRQVGKSTLVKNLPELETRKVLQWNGDDQGIRTLLDSISLAELSELIGNHDLLIIDEAQRFNNIGLIIKQIVDNISTCSIIVTGSSSFELKNDINEPLTGRKWEHILYPLSWSEMVKHHGLLKELSLLEQRLIYGYYPEIVSTNNKKEKKLNLLADSYMFKDILNIEKLLKSDKLVKLLQAIALQIGNLVSYHELAQITGLSSATVEKYIQILESCFIVFRIQCFRRNIRTELNKSRKIYFYDNGIRNSVINNFNIIELRNDVGALWENFLMSERKKYLSYNNIRANTFFWRTKDQSEIDYIEESQGNIHAYEFKYNSDKSRFNTHFIKTYSPVTTQVIHKSNFHQWLK